MSKWLLTLLLVPSLSYGELLRSNDSWHGKDKGQHAIMGAAIGSSITLLTKDPVIGSLAGCGVGLAKEYMDSKYANRDSSMQDFIVTCASSLLAAKITDYLIVSPNRIQYTVRF
jgi:uncharacterized protein YfiM (DUF2279 family)